MKIKLNLASVLAPSRPSRSKNVSSAEKTIRFEHGLTSLKNHSRIGKMTSKIRYVFSLDCLQRNFSQCDKSLLTDRLSLFSRPLLPAVMHI